MRAKAFSTDLFELPLPAGHRFPMEKYRLLREAVRHWPGLELSLPPAASDAQLCLAHDPAYVERLCNGGLSNEEMRAIGFPWSEQMVERSRRSTGATIAACETAIDGPIAIAFNLAGGTHHAGYSRGEGFCCFNDSAVAARLMQRQRACRRVLILDCDVHQGNGTAEIFADDPSVVTASIHAQANFPFQKARSDLDIGLEDGAGDMAYLAAIEDALAWADSLDEIDLLIYLAGADPLEADRLGRLRVSEHGLVERDRAVFAWAKANRFPVAVSMAGGYGQPIEQTVRSHMNTIALGLEIFI